MRTIQTINNNWYFSKEAKTVPASLPTNWEQVTLPHTWNGKDGQDGGNDYHRGTCFYAKVIARTDFPSQDIHYLQFEGVNSTAEVYWNGKKLTTHHGGYSAFRVRLDEILDENLLIVTADNAPNDFVYPQHADFTFYGGIYRSVKIVSVPAAHFDMDYYAAPGLMVTPTVNGTNADVTIESFVTSAENCEVHYEILDGETKILETTVASTDTKATLTIENVHLWHGRKDPHLYTLVANLVKDGAVIDTVQTRFGCRSYSIDPNHGFILNGEEYPLRGVSRHQDRPDIGNALSYEHHKEDMDFICEVGATTIRLAHYQHAQEFYDLCDERGLVIWAEIPYISTHMPGGFENTMSQMRELICQNYNHPSIVVWGLSNEITMGGAADKSLLDNHHKLNDLVHSLDKTRPTTMAAVTMCSMDEDIVHISDVLSYNHYFGWYGGTTDMYGKWFDEFHKKYPNRPIGISEYGCEALNWHTSAPEQGDYTEEYQAYYHEELIKQIADRPYLWATHVWNMFDFAADARAEGGENGMNHKGLMTFDRKYKKDAFFAYKAWLSDEPFVHICGKRYVDRVEDVTKVTVYTSQPEVELFVNGESLGKQTKEKYPFFYFEVPNNGESTLTAKAGNCTDESKIHKVDTFNEDYRMKSEGAVINWFEISTPTGYYSINDTLGDIMSTFRGKIAVLKMLKTMMGGKKDSGYGNAENGNSKNGKKKEAGTVAGFKINKNMVEMAKGFTVKRIVMMLGEDAFSKEQILAINASLNKIKKK